MKGSSIFRLVSIFAALIVMAAVPVSTAQAQDVGVGGGAGIFRPRNPETKKRTGAPTTPVTRRGPTRTAANNAAIEERVEDLLAKGNEFRDARRYAEAETSYQEVLKLKPRDARGAYGLGNVYSDQQRWETAEIAYRNAVLWAPSDVEALVALSVVLVQTRTGAGNARRLADAESFARRAVQIDPKNAVAWDRLGVALQARGLVNNETEHAYRRAVELDPQFAAAYAHLARALNKMGRRDEGVKLYEQAATLAKDPATLNLIAESLQEEQQWQNSEPILKRSLELDPRDPQALYMLGRMLVVFKRFQEAEPHLKLAHEVNPKAFEPLTLLGRTYLALGRLEEAEVTYERAAGLASPADRKQLAGEFGFEGVGDGFMKVKNKPAAVRAYQRALQLNPANRDLERKLAQAR